MVAKIDNVAAAARTTRASPSPTSCSKRSSRARATRFAAVFHSQSADPIGPIRSGRTQDIALFSSFNSPLFVWSGGNAGVTRLIDESTLINMGPNHAPGLLPRAGLGAAQPLQQHRRHLAADPGRPAGPAGAAVRSTSTRTRPSTATPTRGRRRCRVGSTKVDWTWNPEIGKFDRSQNGTPHVDKTYGQIGATNVVIMGVQYQPSAVDRNSPEAQTVGEGPVFVFSDGQVHRGPLEARGRHLPDRSSSTPRATRSRSTPGNTWIELADEVADVDPNKTGVDMIDQAAARLTYRLTPAASETTGSFRHRESTLDAMSDARSTGTFQVKRGLAEMMKGGVIMDVVTPGQAKIAEDAGAVAVMALERVPADIRRDGGVARMSDPEMIEGIKEAVSIPVMAKVRIGHFVEAQIIQALGVDFIDESEVLTPADEAYHIDKFAFDVPFVCGATNLGEALRRISEGAAMIRSKGEAGTGNVVEAVRHLRSIIGDIKKITQADQAELFGWAKQPAGAAAARPGDRRDRQAPRAAVLRRRPRHAGRCRAGDAARRRSGVRRLRHLQVRGPVAACQGDRRSDDALPGRRTSSPRSAAASARR